MKALLAKLLNSALSLGSSFAARIKGKQRHLKSTKGGNLWSRFSRYTGSFFSADGVRAILPRLQRIVARASEFYWRHASDSGEAPLRISSLWWGYFPVFIVALIGLVNTLYFFRQVSNWEHQQVTTSFNEAAQDRVLVVRREFEFALSTIQDIASYFEASSDVRRREFRKFVDPALKRHKGVEVLMWIPYVPWEEREAFENEARISFPPFKIKQRLESGEIVEADSRDEHLPVLYVQPYQQNRELLGLDMVTDRDVLALLSESRDSKQLRVSKRIMFEDEQGQHAGFRVAVPVFFPLDDPVDGEEDPPLSQLSRIRGYAVGIYRIGDIVELALASLSVGGIDIRLVDVTDQMQEDELYTHESRLRSANEGGIEPPLSRLSYQQTLLLGSRQWRIICTPVAGSYRPDSWSGWIVMIGGLAFTALLTVYVSTLVGRAKKIRQLVDLRTLELSSANEALNREISERKAAERELTELNNDLEFRVAVRSSEAERRARDLEQFAYVASHDLKAPLRAISNLTDWISEDLEEKLDDASREQLNLLRDRVQRMNALIEGLLEYSRVGRTGGFPALVDTRALLEEVIDSLSPPKGFSIKLGKELPVFRTDRLLLSQVFSNLISNSLKHHGGKRGRIKIESRQMRRFYEFTVADNGVGIAPEYHKKVFMIFQTLQAKDYGSNTGIGLALVKKIVEEQGGWITLESEPGKGALFRFTWPAEPVAKMDEEEAGTLPA